MRLLLIGEKIKSIEQKFPGLLARHGIDARPIIRTRDFLSHHYEDIDIDAIMLICKINLPDLEIKSVFKFNIRMAGRFNFILTKAFFAGVCGQYGEKNNAGQGKIGR
ncbi:MAG: HepT-like ribonuclease domain-containing protein, partial [Saprospiraceae bacterium]